MRLRLGAVRGSILAVLVGCTVLSGCTDHDDLPDPPWGKGDLISPASTSDHNVASVARSQQWDQAWRATRPLGDEVSEQVNAETTFDQNFIHAGAGYRAGLMIFHREGDTDDEPEIDVMITEFDSRDHARSELADWKSKSKLLKRTAASVHGASDAAAYSGPTGLSPCKVNDPIDVAVRFLVADRIAAEVMQACVPAADRAAVVSRLSSQAGKVAAFARRLSSTALPGMWFDRASGLNILSTGRWDQQQYVITGRTDGLDLDPLVPEPFAGTGVRLEFDTVDVVLVYADAASARRAMTRLTTDQGWTTNRYGGPPKPHPSTYAEEQYCADGYHPGESGTCWSRVGRFIDITSIEHGERHTDEDQLKALTQAK